MEQVRKGKWWVTLDDKGKEVSRCRHREKVVVVEDKPKPKRKKKVEK